MRTFACSDRAARCRRAPLARAFAALLVAVFAGLATPDADHAAFAQTQSQPAREAPAPAASLLPTQAERERFQALAEELRCLVCQNQTLADSDAALAADLRREVEELMLAGRSDDQIKAHLVQRYGDFVLYRPPMQRNTWLLWLGPFALLVGGGFAWWRVQRAHRARTAAGNGSGGIGTGTGAKVATAAAGSGPTLDTEATGQAASDADLERARRLLE